MKAVAEIVRYLYGRQLLDDQHMSRLDELGLVPHDFYCEVCGELLCEKKGHSWDPWREWDARYQEFQEELEHQDPTPPPPAPRRGKGTPSHAIRADEIAKRIKASELLRDPCLSVLRDLSGGDDWLKSLHEAAEDVLDEILLAKLKSYEVTPTDLWNALVFDRYRGVVDLTAATGPAATAWSQVILGRDASEMGKFAWVLGARRMINRVWQLVRGQDAVLRSLGRLITTHAEQLGRWAERDYHPVGSLCLCLVYEAQALSAGRHTHPELRPEWSNWDGQRYRKSEWTTEEAAARSWELAFRVDAAKSYALLGKAADWSGPLSLESPLTHPRYWNS